MKALFRLILLALVVAGGWWAWHGPLLPLTIIFTFPLEQQAEYEHALLAYDGGVALPLSREKELTDTVTRHGKVLIMACTNLQCRIHPDYFALPDRLRARTPAEVQTVLFTNRVLETIASNRELPNGATTLDVHTEDRLYLLSFAWPSKQFLGRRLLAPSGDVKDVSAVNILAVVQKLPGR